MCAAVFNRSYYMFKMQYVNIIRYSTAASTVKPFKSIPGLSSLPFIGPLHHFIPGIGSVGFQPNFYELSKKLYEKFGPIVKLDGLFARASMVILYEPEHFDQVYRAEEVLPSRPGFETGTYYRTTLRKSTFEGIYGLTTAEGLQWRDFRTKVNPALLKPKLVKLYTPTLQEIAEEMVARLIRLKDDTKYLQENFNLEMTKWSLESVAVVALGSRLGGLNDSFKEGDPSPILIKCARDIINLSFKLELRPSLWKFISTRNFKNLVKAYDLQWDTSLKLINETKSHIIERGHDIPEEDKSVVEKLLAIDEKVAVAMANEMMLAGIDTVAFTTISLLYKLATNQQCQDKLREEIRASEHSNKYLRACLKESLRLNAVISANLRRTTKEHVVAGYQIPKGVDVLAPNELLSRMDKYYARAEEFLPERWLVDKTDPLYYGNCPAMVTLPFGFGIRSCIGRRIAELEMEVFVKTLIRNVKVTWEGPPAQVVAEVMNTFKKPFHFKFHLL